MCVAGGADSSEDGPATNPVRVERSAASVPLVRGEVGMNGEWIGRDDAKSTSRPASRGGGIIMNIAAPAAHRDDLQ